MMRKRPLRAAACALALLAASPLAALPAVARPAPQTATAMDFLAALGRHDMGRAATLLDADAVLELPYAGSGLTVTGREAVLAFLEKTMAGSMGTIAYRLDRAYPSPAARALVLEVSTQAQTATGRSFANRLVAIFVFRKGRIALFREYFNPAPLARQADR